MLRHQWSGFVVAGVQQQKIYPQLAGKVTRPRQQLSLPSGIHVNMEVD